MRVISTTKARENIKSIVDRVKYHGEVFVLKRRQEIDAMIIGFPSNYNPNLNEITNINANSKSFDFLKDEPNLYSIKDIKTKYA